MAGQYYHYNYDSNRTSSTSHEGQVRSSPASGGSHRLSYSADGAVPPSLYGQATVFTTQHHEVGQPISQYGTSSQSSLYVYNMPVVRGGDALASVTSASYDQYPLGQGTAPLIRVETGHNTSSMSLRHPNARYGPPGQPQTVGHNIEEWTERVMVSSPSESIGGQGTISHEAPWSPVNTRSQSTQAEHGHSHGQFADPYPTHSNDQTSNLTVPYTQGQQHRRESLSPSVESATSSTPDPVKCTSCGKTYRGDYRKGNLARHRRQKHGEAEQIYLCEEPGCHQDFKRKDARLKHYRKHHAWLAPNPPLSRRSE